MSMKPFSYYDLLQAFSASGCPMCRLVQRDAHQYLDSLLYEYVTDPDIHLSVRASRGLCNPHSWQLRELTAASAGVAVLYEAALDEALKSLPDTSENSSISGLRRLVNRPNATAVADRLAGQPGCLCCSAMEANEARYLETLSKAFLEPDYQAAYARSEGLCLPHFRQTLAQMNSSGLANWLIQTQRQIWQALMAELDQFRIKSDPNYQGGPMGREADSWVRAMEKLVGAQSVFGMHDR